MSTLPLFSLLTDVAVLAQHGPTDVPVLGLTLDSRQAGPGQLFCALRGTATDGHNFIDKAVGQGAAVVVCEELPATLSPATTYVQVADSAAALGPSPARSTATRRASSRWWA